MAGFFERQRSLTPETYDLYGPYSNQIGDLSGWYADAANRANQKTAQIYGQTGLQAPQKGGNRAGPMYASMARNATDIENQRAKTQYEDKYRYLQGRRMYTPTESPSGAAQFMGPLLYGGLYAKGGDILQGGYNVLKDLGGSAYDSLFGGAAGGYSQPYAGYGGMEGGWGEPGNYGGWDSSYSDLSGSALSDISGAFQPAYDIPADIPDFSSAYQDIPSLW